MTVCGENQLEVCRPGLPNLKPRSSTKQGYGHHLPPAYCVHCMCNIEQKENNR